MRVPRTTRGGADWPLQTIRDFPGLDSSGIALTIDDGPTPHTQEVLDLLDLVGIRATFFVIGELAQRYPDAIQSIVASGHNIGLHGWSHTRFPRLASTELAAELAQTQGALPVATTMVRPPYGDLDRPTLDWLKGEGFDVVGWSVHAEDWVLETPRELIVGEIVMDADPGDVLLTHDLSSATQMLSQLIPALHARGFHWTQLAVEGRSLSTEQP